MPALIAAPWLGTAIAGIAGGTAAVVGAKMTSGATEDAATATTAAANHAADLTAQGAAATLAYEKDQAAQTQANFNTTQKANYDQWASAQQRKSAYGQMFGAPAQSIPGYVPPTDTTSDGTLGSMATTPTSTTTTPGSTSSNPTDPTAIAAQLTANYKSLGVAPTGPGSGPTDLAYYATQIAKTGGLTPQNSAYWFGPSGRIASDLSKASGGGGSAAAAAPVGAISTAGAGTLGAYLQPSTLPITGNLAMPQPGTLASYAGAR